MNLSSVVSAKNKVITELEAELARATETIRKMTADYATLRIKTEPTVLKNQCQDCNRGFPDPLIARLCKACREKRLGR